MFPICGDLNAPLTSHSKDIDPNNQAMSGEDSKQKRNTQ